MYEIIDVSMPQQSPRRMSECLKTKGKLIRLIDTLPEENSTLLVLYYFEGLSHGEIAKGMDLSISTVIQRIVGAVSLLQPKVQKAGLDKLLSEMIA